MLKDIGSACTACRACAEGCPVNVISFKEDDYGMLYPHVDINKCIQCNICNKVCHVQTDILNNSIRKNYAGYSLAEEKNKSASGGICSALYQYALDKNWKTFGVVYDINTGAQYIEITDQNDIGRVKNSKYVYSDMSICFKKIREYLDAEQIILFIGLPCQVAALKSYIQVFNRNLSNLYLIEIICHGIAPEVYLNKHIASIEAKYKRKADQLSFRDPEFGTKNYVFSLRTNNKVFYKCNDIRTDAYQLGYHNAIIYRENCYQCKYAKKDRVSDLVLGDWYYDGNAPKVVFDDENISSILCCSDKGEQLLELLLLEKRICISERPISEVINVQTTLTNPHEKNIVREKFLLEYKKTGDFDESMKKVYLSQMIKNEIKYHLKIRQIKQLIKKIIGIS